MPDAPAAGRLTADEIVEFECLDATAPLDEIGRPAWSFEGEPLTVRERRWLELYRKLAKCEDASETRQRRR
ncbi:hypothetical protein [Bradyrhizobium sp. USDA 4486]